MSSDSPPNKRLFVSVALLVCLGVTAFVSWKLVAGRNEPAKTNDVDGIPDGPPEQLIAYIEDQVNHLKANQLSLSNEKKTLRKINKAATKVLAAKPEDPTIIRKATEARTFSLARLASDGDEEAAKEIEAFLKKMRSHQLAEIREFATTQYLLAMVMSPRISQEAVREELVREAVAFFKESMTRQRLQIASSVAERLEYQQQNEAAGKLFEGIAGVLQGSQDPQIQALATPYRGFARRARLPSSKLTVLKGATVDGKTFDWSAYKGKVVLIDFWATWCKPCRDELPNVKRNYFRYHDRGFDVVGISLDRERSKLTRFLQSSPLPWTNLFHPTFTESHPMADHYGVKGIPFTILVGRDGKVIATNVRGPALEDHLKRLFDKSAGKAPAPPN